jgi:molecular chaperone DnaJ
MLKNLGNLQFKVDEQSRMYCRKIPLGKLYALLRELPNDFKDQNGWIKIDDKLDKVVKEKCKDCGGKGYIHKKKTIKVKVPAGINEGQQIISRGNGERGVNGGENGDLYFEIVIKEHPYFKRDGNDIQLEIPLDIVDACLGTKVDVPTVYGDMTLTIPAGSQPNQILRMKGCGVKDLRSGKPGDQYIKLNIKVPTTLSKSQKEHLEKIREETDKKNESLFTKFKKMFKK